MTRTADLLLVNLFDDEEFRFRRFPGAIQTNDEANWEQLDVAAFTKPLSYANTDAQVVELQDVWLDKSGTNESVLPEIERLRALTRRDEEAASPPLLQLIAGDWSVLVVLKSIRTERTRFTGDNLVTRAKLSLTFWEAQDSRPRPGSRPRDAAFSF